MTTDDDSKLAPSHAQRGKAGKGVRSTVAAARKLRRNMTDVEQKLWDRIRDKQIEEFRFRRQRPMGRYVVDFVCLDAKLIVELDGGQHAGQVEADAKRTEFLQSLGFEVMRFWNNDVVENVDGVLERIREHLLRYATSNPSPTLPFAGEGAGRAKGAGDANAPSEVKRGRRVRERLSTEFTAIRKATASSEAAEVADVAGDGHAASEPPPSPAKRGKAGMGVRPPADATRRRKARKPA